MTIKAIPCLSLTPPDLGHKQLYVLPPLVMSTPPLRRREEIITIKIIHSISSYSYQEDNNKKWMNI